MRPIFLIFLFFLGASAMRAQVVLNEFSASNHDYQDFDDGFEEEFADWIELYNPTGADIDVGGYFLSDEINDPTKFEIPAGTIVPANDYLIILATGFYELDPNMFGYLNTTFKITQTKPEALVFADNSGTILSSFEFLNSILPTHRNHSYGRSGDGGTDWVYFTNPTPDAANGTAGFVTYTQEVISTVEAGYYGGAQSVSLSCPDATATIYYTLDGSIPTTGSTVYSGPINLNNTTTLRAMALSGDAERGESLVMTNTYFFGTDQHSIPVVNIAGETLNDGEWFGDELCHIEFFNDDGTFWVESTGDSNEHGNDSNAYDQRGFDYITRDEMGDSWALFAELFPTKNRDDFQRLIFKAAANDNYTFSGGAHIRDAYCQTLSDRADLKLDERTSESCILYINGQYWGVYEYREKVDDPDFTIEYYDQPRNFLDYIKIWGGTWTEYGSIDDWDDLRDFILTNDMSNQANYDYVTSVYNVTSLMDYMILNTYTVNADWLNWNTSWWRGRHPDGSAKKWRYSLWDMDNTFGHGTNYTNLPSQDSDADPCDPEQLGDVDGEGHVLIFNALLDNEQFQAAYYNRWASLSNQYFSCEYMNGLLDEMAGRIAPEMERQCQRWGGTVAGWEAAVQEMRDFIDERCTTTTTEGLEDCYDIESVNLTVIIDGVGEVDISAATVTDAISPWTGQFWLDIPIDLEAQFEDGQTFLFWEVQSGNVVLADPTNPELTVTLTEDATIVAYFGVPEPVDIQFLVEPAGAGTIALDGNDIAPLPNTMTLDWGSYNLEASTTNPWTNFSHWETNNANVNPTDTDPIVDVYFNETDTVVAVFEITPHFELTVDVQPAGAGTVVMNGNALTLPWNDVVEGEVDYTFFTNAIDQWHEFSHWEINNNVIQPDEFSQDILVNLTASDVIIAVYEIINSATVTVMVDPPYSGTITTSNGITTSDSETMIIVAGTTLQFDALPADFRTFDGWTSDVTNANPSNDQMNVDFTLNVNDTIVAHFIPEEFVLFIPNSFTPNNDGTNDIFQPIAQAVDVSSYQMQIFNRWGEVVFSSEDPQEGWDGSHNSGEYYVDGEIYMYRVKLRSVHAPDEQVFEGHLTVIR